VKVLRKDIYNPVQELQNQKWRDFEGYHSEEIQPILLHVNEIVLWCGNDWRKFLRFWSLVHLVPKIITYIPVDQSTVVFFDDNIS
jgi:hypothetical protein